MKPFERRQNSHWKRRIRKLQRDFEASWHVFGYLEATFVSRQAIDQDVVRWLDSYLNGVAIGSVFGMKRPRVTFLSWDEKEGLTIRMRAQIAPPRLPGLSSTGRAYRSIRIAPEDLHQLQLVRAVCVPCRLCLETSEPDSVNLANETLDRSDK